MIDPKVFKQVRKALGLSQQELADALGLSRVTVNKMERGRLRRGIPDEVADRLMALKPGAKRKPEVVIRTLEDTGGALMFQTNVNDDSHLWDNEEDDNA